MRITCTNCATSYEVTASSLGPTGRSVRCVRCQHVWFAANTEALASVAIAHRAEVAEFSANTSVAGLAAPPPPPPEAPPVEDEDIAVVEATAPETSPEVAAQEHGGSVKAPALAAEAIDDPPPPEAEPPQEPAAIADAPPLAPDSGDRAAPPQDTLPPLEDIETVAARRARRLAEQRRRRVKPTMTTAILALMAINIALIGWRADVVRWLPQTASLYAAIGLPVNLRGLVFMDVATDKESQEGVAVLVVGGTIANVTPRAVTVPRLRFALRNGAGQEVYSWTALPTKNVLAPGETLPFRSRLASPPRDGNQVMVRFFNRHDLVAGMQ
jgi:predicted Zn finger-like uncharacterized protein